MEDLCNNPIAGSDHALHNRAGDRLIIDCLGTRAERSTGCRPDEVLAKDRRAARESDGEGGAETRRDATTLDRVHAAMLFQASGASNALRALLETEIGRGPEFLRLANALTALYPKDSEEKRILDAMLLAVPR